MQATLVQLLQAVLGIAIIVSTPFVIKTLKSIENYFISVVGSKNYAFVKEFITDMIKAHADVFSEQEIVTILNTLDDKFGDILSHNEIKQIVDVVIIDLNREVQTQKRINTLLNFKSKALL